MTTTEYIFDCKRAILFLSSSKIFTPHPPLRPASVYPLPLLRGEDTLAGRREGWGVNILEDERNRLPSCKICTLCDYYSESPQTWFRNTVSSLPVPQTASRGVHHKVPLGCFLAAMAGYGQYFVITPPPLPTHRTNCRASFCSQGLSATQKTEPEFLNF